MILKDQKIGQVTSVKRLNFCRTLHKERNKEIGETEKETDNKDSKCE